MWLSYQALKSYQRKPSDELEVTDTLAAWCLNGAVLWFGITIENALGEREPVGDPKKGQTRQKYTLEQLLEDDFILPRPPTKAEKRKKGTSNLLDMASDPASGVKMWRELKPGEIDPRAAQNGEVS